MKKIFSILYQVTKRDKIFVPTVVCTRPKTFKAFRRMFSVASIASVVLSVSLSGCGSSTDKAGENSPEPEIMAEMPTDSKLTGSVEVVCFESMLYQDFLEEAKAAFELKHPGTTITVTTFSKLPEIKTMETEDGSVVSFSVGSDDKERQDYINRINTEIMGGGGPDILAMDVLPYYKYADSGVLEDLRAYMDADEDFDESNYRSNILKGVRYKGGQYIMPLDFGFRFISLNKERVGEAAQKTLREKGSFTYEEMIALTKEQFANDSEGSRMIDYQGKAQAFSLLMGSDYKKYIDIENKRANFTDGSFSKLLSMINEQGNNGYFMPSYESSGELTQDFMDSWSLYYFKNQTNYMLKQIFYPYDEAAYEAIGTFTPPRPDEIAGLLVNDSGEAEFRCYQTYAINANSQSKELAWEFIKFMLTDEMQLSLKLLGTPVSNTAFEEYSTINLTKFPNYKEADNELGYEVTGYEMMEDQKYLDAYAAYLEHVNRFMDALKLYTINDEVLNEMVEKAVALYFDGSRSADEVADTLQNRVELYLSE